MATFYGVEFRLILCDQTGMDAVHLQYETYPYPERDPADESTRLIEGSPSHPREIDHFLFGGTRDWSQPFRALVAGGGTGDGLIMLAQKLADLNCPAEITYIDMSSASREIAEARAAARGLTVRFITGDLLTAPDYGPFDYIDCCGVLHHLADPDAGFAALAAALSPDGGLGCMVYAPLGRSGVYPLQDAFSALFAEDTPSEKVRLAKAALSTLPAAHPFAVNALVGDHKQGDAGLYDLLLHARDRAYTAPDLMAALDRAGLALVSWLEPARYDPLSYLPADAAFAERLHALDPAARAGLAENLAGTLKTHVAYAAPKARAAKAMAKPTKPDLVPHLSGAPAKALAQQVHGHGGFTLTLDGQDYSVTLPPQTAPMIARIDGRASLGQIAGHQPSGGQDWLAFASAWGPVHRALTEYNLLHYSKGVRL